MSWNGRVVLLLIFGFAFAHYPLSAQSILTNKTIIQMTAAGLSSFTCV
jgi:hypothetical protein